MDPAVVHTGGPACRAQTLQFILPYRANLTGIDVAKSLGIQRTLKRRPDHAIKIIPEHIFDKRFVEQALRIAFVEFPFEWEIRSCESAPSAR